MVEVAEHGERERARDRRGRHREQVRVLALGRERPPLRDAEAVLLVDHRQAQPRQLDRLGQQRVRADHDRDVAVLERARQHVALARRRRARRRTRCAGRAAWPACAGWRSAARPAARSARAARWCRPAARAAAAASTASTVLPVPTSPTRSRFIGDGRARSARISAHTRSWSPVSRNGSAASALLLGVGREHQRLRRARAQLAPPLLEPELEQEQLLRDEPQVIGRVAGAQPLGLEPDAGQVHLAERRADLGEVQLRDVRLRQPAVDEVARAAQRRLDQPAHAARRQAFDRGVARHDPRQLARARSRPRASRRPGGAAPSRSGSGAPRPRRARARRAGAAPRSWRCRGTT